MSVWWMILKTMMSMRISWLEEELKDWDLNKMESFKCALLRKSRRPQLSTLLDDFLTLLFILPELDKDQLRGNKLITISIMEVLEKLLTILVKLSLVVQIITPWVGRNTTKEFLMIWKETSTLMVMKNIRCRLMTKIMTSKTI